MADPIEVRVPDIGGFKDVSVIEVLVRDGQTVDKESPLITIETEKAAMDVPAPAAGRITSVKVKQGDKVSEGSVILLLEAAATAETAAAEDAAAPPMPPATTPKSPAAPVAIAASAVSAAKAGSVPRAVAAAPIDEKAFSRAYASPAVRKFAREVGADLGVITGTGPKARISQDDVKAYVKKILLSPVPAGSALPKVPEVDFARFGAVSVEPLSRIQKISSARLHASWVNIPHVTQYEDADITDLDAVRSTIKAKAAAEGAKLTPLVFIIRACLVALQRFPRFNASLDSTGENLVFKQYFNIGFAADTPHGLVVPVIRDADKMSIYEIARALAGLSAKARAGKLVAAEMQGGSFTISSLGGIGGTAFTPIINAPEVAILGVAKAAFKPVYVDGAFVPRLMLPLSLSYDHRVIDGAEAARFAVFLAKTLRDVRALT